MRRPTEQDFEAIAGILKQGKDNASGMAEQASNFGARDGTTIRPRMAGDQLQGAIAGALATELRDPKAAKMYQGYVGRLQSGPFSLGQADGGNQRGGMA